MFFFGEHFGPINVVGLAILLTGVSLYNYTKYQKMKQGEIKPSRMGPPADLKRDSGSDGAKGDSDDVTHQPGDVSLSETHFRHKQAEEEGERKDHNAQKLQTAVDSPRHVGNNK